jgi:hypothetical protein
MRFCGMGETVISSSLSYLEQVSDLRKANALSGRLSAWSKTVEHTMTILITLLTLRIRHTHRPMRGPGRD